MTGSTSACSQGKASGSKNRNVEHVVFAIVNASSEMRKMALIALQRKECTEIFRDEG